MMKLEETLTMLQLQRTICQQALQLARLNTEIALRDLAEIEPRIAETELAIKDAQEPNHG